MKKKRMMPLIVGNWKMHPDTLAEAKDIAKKIKKGARGLSKTKMVVCPPFLYVPEVKTIIGRTNIAIGVQNISSEEAGSHTGDISAVQAASCGAEYAVVGHSERRKIGETDEIVAKKALLAIRNGLVAIVCVGEAERDAHGKYLAFLKDQLARSLATVSAAELKKLVIAYEPVWEIGASAAMSPGQIHETSIYIRKVLSDLYTPELVSKMPILYGGSVNVSNAQAILKDGEVDGLLIGRESLVPADFIAIAKIANELK
ncbi:MAG: triose-phosphate isomerase [Patescibacteria group bacterium]